MRATPQQAHGWTLLFHACLSGQLDKLNAAAQKAEQTDPKHASANANVKLFKAVSTLILEIIPQDPGHWRRAKIGRRFRLFFRYDSSSKIIIYAWTTMTESRCAEQTNILSSLGC